MYGYGAAMLSVLCGMTFLLLCSMLVYFRWVQHQVVVEHVSLSLKNKTEIDDDDDDQTQHSGDEQMEELIICHLSDFHYDGSSRNQKKLDVLLNQILIELERQRPDIILLTGDYINHDTKALSRFCHTFLKRLPSLCRHRHHHSSSSSTTVYASLGNHDAYGESLSPEIYKTCRDYVSHCLAQAGIKVLRNEMIQHSPKYSSQNITDIWICGLADLWDPEWRHHAKVMQKLNETQEDSLRIVMSHNPDTAKYLSEYDYSLQLSGHVHGGQICLPPSLISSNGNRIPVLGLCRPILDYVLIPIVTAILGKHNILTQMRAQHKYCFVTNHWEWSQGLFQLKKKKHQRQNKYLYTNRGIGSHYNMRLFCPPELTFLRIPIPRNKTKKNKSH